jgi:hypothetical protein
MPIEAKGIDVEMGPNYIHLIMASNEDHVVPAGHDERRFLVLDVSTEHQKDTSYFKAILTQLENGGYQALLHHLRTMDLDGFNVRNAPDTGALDDQKMQSMSPEEDWWYSKLADGELLPGGGGWPEVVVKDKLVENYVEHAKQHGGFRRASSLAALGMFFTKVWGSSATGLSCKRVVDVDSYTTDGYLVTQRKTRPCWAIPSLAECRNIWDGIYGAQDWRDDGGQMDIPQDAPSDQVESPF